MDFLPLWASLMAQKCKESACNAEDTGDIVLILGLRRSPGVGSGNPLQYSCLKDLIDRGARRAVVQRFVKSQT